MLYARFRSPMCALHPDAAQKACRPWFSWASKTCSTRARTFAFVPLPCCSRFVSFLPRDPFLMIMLLYPSSSKISPERYGPPTP